MPELDQLITEDATAWRAAVDAQARRVRVRVRDAMVAAEDESSPARTALAACVTAAAIAAAVTGFVVASSGGSGGSGGGVGGGDGQASCVAPQITLNKSHVRQGEAITVSGSYFLAECNDVQVRGASPQPNKPLSRVDLSLIDSNAKRLHMTTVRPDSAGSFTAIVRIPANASTGAAKLVDGSGQSISFMIMTG